MILMSHLYKSQLGVILGGYVILAIKMMSSDKLKAFCSMHASLIALDIKFYNACYMPRCCCIHIQSFITYEILGQAI